MKHIILSTGYQVSFSSLDELIAPGDPVRLMEAFDEKLDLNKSGFLPKAIASEGRQPFDLRLFLKIYLYSYQIV